MRGLRVLGGYFRYTLSYINNPSNRKRLKVTSYRNTDILRNKLVNLLKFSLTKNSNPFLLHGLLFMIFLKGAMQRSWCYLIIS